MGRQRGLSSKGLRIRCFVSLLQTKEGPIRAGYVSETDTKVAAEKNAMRGTFANFRTFQRVPLDKPSEPRHKAAQ
ncbi:MAG: hypothetical protein QOG84_2272 [Sphingomonadales bacterium]|jgi:hypothetical protein|nr:hypothetical protein [Sphingomonadales bacterium]